MMIMTMITTTMPLTIHGHFRFFLRPIGAMVSGARTGIVGTNPSGRVSAPHAWPVQ
jgi:hypothetical protein